MRVRIEAAHAGPLLLEARTLFSEYAASLGIDLGFQGFESELAGLPGAYAPPSGRLLVARLHGTSAGCVAVRALEPGICEIEIHFADTTAMIRQERERGVLVARADGIETSIDCITRSLARETEELIVRLLKRPEADRVYLRTLKIARRLAA